MSRVWYSAKEIAGLPGLPGTDRGVTKLANRENWESQKRLGKGGGWEYHIANLPQAAQGALAVQNAKTAVQSRDVTALVKQYAAEDGEKPFHYDRETLWSCFERAPESMKTKAKYCLEVVLMVEQLTLNGLSKTAAVCQAMSQYGEGRATVYRWLGMVQGYDRADALAALLPKYRGRTSTAELSDDAWEFIKADYLRQEKPAASACYHRLVRAAKDLDWTVPTQRTVERRLADIPKAQQVLLREGENALLRLYPALDRSVSDLHALEGINGDGYQHNVFVKWPDGDIARPKTWVWQDIHSRKILSYRVDLTENSDMLRLSFGDLVEQFGIPDHATIDNTRAAANKWMSGQIKTRYRFKVKEDDPMGLFPLLGVKVHWTTVLNGHGHGQAKPIERAFGVGGIGEVVDKHPAFAGAYTGHNTTAKPENYGSTAVPLKTFLEVLNQEIIAWNARPGRRTEMGGGVRSFDQVFNDSYARAPIRKATAEQRRLWLLTAEAVQVQRDGCVSLAAGARVGEGSAGKNRYFHLELQEYIGKKLVVRFDPQGLHEDVHLYSLDGRFIATASCQQAAGFYDTETGREHSRIRKQFMKATKIASQAQLKLDSLDVAKLLPAPTLPDPVESKVVRPFRPATRAHEAPPQQDDYWAKQAQRGLEQAAQPIAEPRSGSVVSLGDDPQKYRRWLDLHKQVCAGQMIDDERLQRFYQNFPKSPAFAVQQELAQMRQDLKDRIA